MAFLAGAFLMVAAAFEPSGAALYARHCSVAYCHGAEGGAGRAPAIRGRSWREPDLRRVVTEGIPGTSMPPFEGKLTPEEVGALIDYVLSLSSVGESEPASDLNLGKGESIFYDGSRGRCAACHRFGRDDFPGPDLAKTGKAPGEIVRDITDPAASVNGAKPFIEVVTASGDRFPAVREEETERYLRVHDLSAMPPVLRRLSREEILRIEPLSRSVMPQGFGTLYTEEELLDLASFIYSRRSPSPPSR